MHQNTHGPTVHRLPPKKNLHYLSAVLYSKHILSGLGFGAIPRVQFDGNFALPRLTRLSSLRLARVFPVLQRWWGKILAPHYGARIGWESFSSYVGQGGAGMGQEKTMQDGNKDLILRPRLAPLPSLCNSPKSFNFFFFTFHIFNFYFLLLLIFFLTFLN